MLCSSTVFSSERNITAGFLPVRKAYYSPPSTVYELVVLYICFPVMPLWRQLYVLPLNIESHLFIETMLLVA